MHEQLSTEDLKINDLIKKARTLLVPTEEKPIGRYYWVARGWPLAVAQAKIVEARKHKKPKLSPFSREFWSQKINPETNQFFTEDEAEFKRNSLRPIRPQYWIKKGFSKEEAAEKATQTKNENNRRGARAVKNRSKEEIKSFSPRCIEYWVARGYPTSDAKEQVKAMQTTFSLEKCIEKHGEDEGPLVWQTRQDKWQNALNSKSHEELESINQRKIWKAGSMSKISQTLFEKIHIDGARWGPKRAGNDGEKMVKLHDRNVMIDYSLHNKIIEFNGDYWHANPKKYKSTDVIMTRRLGPITADFIWAEDKKRTNELESLGYKVLIIWEYDYKENTEREIQKCINFLTR